jgi:hypothetical protein
MQIAGEYLPGQIQAFEYFLEGQVLSVPKDDNLIITEYERN